MLRNDEHQQCDTSGNLILKALGSNKHRHKSTSKGRAGWDAPKNMQGRHRIGS